VDEFIEFLDHAFWPVTGKQALNARHNILDNIKITSGTVRRILLSYSTFRGTIWPGYIVC